MDQNHFWELNFQFKMVQEMLRNIENDFQNHVFWTMRAPFNVFFICFIVFDEFRGYYEIMQNSFRYCVIVFEFTIVTFLFVIFCFVIIKHEKLFQMCLDNFWVLNSLVRIHVPFVIITNFKMKKKKKKYL